MAKVLIDPTAGSLSVLARSAAELALLAHGRAHGGQLVLLEVYYPVCGDSVVLPQNISVHGARRVRAALEQAADAHQQAQHRRASFRLVKTVKTVKTDPGRPGPPRNMSDRRDR